LTNIYEFANTATDMADDFCDHQIISVSGMGPTNCDLAAYGLDGLGYMSRGAGMAM
jgi:hypothetical protein